MRFQAIIHTIKIENIQGVNRVDLTIKVFEMYEGLKDKVV